MIIVFLKILDPSPRFSQNQTTVSHFLVHTIFIQFFKIIATHKSVYNNDCNIHTQILGEKYQFFCRGQYI